MKKYFIGVFALALLMPITTQAGFTGGFSDPNPRYLPHPPAQNFPPRIRSISGPSKLNVSQRGTWYVDATDPESNPLTYKVDWGDFTCQAGYTCNNYGRVTLNSFAPAFSDFTHSYANPGVYTLTFTVQDSAGLTAISSTSVEVYLATSSLRNI